ncbi:hypothetical protein CRM22_010121 [Opisthorchis felineus]|uniref:ZMYM2-like/QRICH1 C-terminal domain-containing protein n=1 Tax=Opisthorchis felineus TaxID=147828 RepID=A0A4S2L8D5_OPIFE|nr:hypothetical protein CRM22_010121 [Opisthorchis felineus]
MSSLVKHCPLPRTDAETSTRENIEAPGYMTPISGDGDLIQEDDCENRDDIHQYLPHTRSSDGSVGDGTGTTSLLDEALSAAMEAIADANRFNAASNNCDTETVSCSDVVTNHPPISSITSSMESTDKLASHLDLRSDRFFPSTSSSFDFIKDMDEKVQVDHGASENSKSKTDWVPTSPGTQDTKATNALALISLGSSLGTLTSFFANWRPILRPLFERTLIERLWSFGELGATGPQPLLLSMWFIISRHFGVGCRTEHAKLVYGNVDIGTDPVTGQKQLQFFRTVRPLVGNQAPSSESPNSFRSPEPNVVVPEQPDKPDRCPVWLFQRFRAHRPFTVNFPSCPLYLQPERHASMNTPLMGTDNDIIWYTTNGLGKNKIGAMLNLALQNVGVPIVRQINLSRFCDALAAAVLTPAGGEVGARLGELVKMYKQSSDQEQLRQEMESCAERIVNQSTNPDSPIHQLLLRICAAKEKPKTQTRTARNTPKVHTNHDRKDSSVNGAVHKLSIHSTQAISAHHPPCDSNTNRRTDILVRSTSDVVGSSASHLPPTMVLLPSVSGSHSSQSHTIANSPETLGLNPSSLPLDENVIDISRLTNFDHLASVNLSSTSTTTRTSEAQPMRENQFSNTVVTTSYLHPDPSDQSLFSTNEDLQIRTHKSGSETNRSIRLEMRDLLDLVLAAAKTSSIDSPDRVHNEIRRLQVVNTVQRPPVGLVTQLLWRARALDDRGPWILTFSMWWLMQHYFGIGTRMHHVRLCWGHLRLVSNVHDPMTGELCEAIEYVGPPEFTTLRACALVESCGDSLRVRRVYPSSGWAEAEITIAGALSAECASDRPRIRPLETTTDVPTIQARAGPNFVELYKAFARRRQRPSLRPEAPFYVQPLQTYPMMLNSRPDIVWYSVGALGKNRIGALMRNIVDKVVRPNLPRVAQAATSSARKACILATQRAAQALPALPSDSAHELDERRQLMLNKLSCILGLNSTTVMEQMSSKSVEPSSSSSDESPRSCWNTYSLLPTTSTSNACSNNTVLLPSSSLPSTTVAAQTKSAISVREFTLGLARGSLPQAIPQNTPFTASDLQHQLAGGTATSNVIWNPSSCFSSTTQSYNPYPTTGLVLLTSPDGKSTQLAAIQQQQQHPCTNRVLLLPTADGNAALLSGHGLAVCVDRSLTNQTVQPYQKESVLHPAQQQTILASVGGQLVKTNNLTGLTSRTGQTVAYLTQPQTNRNSCTMGTAPVRLVLLSASNEDPRTASTSQPSFLVGGDSQMQQVPYSQPIKQENSVIATPTVDCLHITSPVNSQPDTGTNDVVTFPDRLGSLVSSNTSRPLNLPVRTRTVLQARNVTLPPEYAEQRFKPEQISPTGSMYDPPPPPPIVIQAITPDGRVFNLSHAPQATSSEDIKPQFYDQVYEDPDPDEATAGELLSTYGQHRITNVGMPCLPEVTSFSATSDRSVHGVFPISSATSRVPNSPSTQSSVSSVVVYSERKPIPAESTSTLTSNDETPISKVASVKKSASVDKPLGRASGTATQTCGYLPILSELACSLPIPEPSPDSLRTLQEAINSARAFQCGDFPSYVEKLFRRGILSANQPFLLNFCAWFINSVAFEVENRSEHGNLRWGDFQLGKTADGLTEFLYFVNPVTNKSYYLAAGPDSSYKLGVSEELAPLDNEPLPVRCPCPVAIFKALRDHRPLSCRYLHAKFYLQPLTRQELANASIRQGSSSAVIDWFTERPWGKNKLGSLFGEAARLAGLPVIYLRKHRIQSNPHTTIPGVIASTVNNASVVQSSISFGDSPTVSTLPNYLPSLLESASGSGESPQTELKRRRISHSPANEHSTLSPATFSPRLSFIFQKI